MVSYRYICISGSLKMCLFYLVIVGCVVESIIRKFRVVIVVLIVSR